MAVVPVPAQLSLKAAAAALGVAKATMADRAAAERSTGYVIGGISPFGQRKRLPTVIDSSAMRWDRVLCSAGKRGWDVAVTAGPHSPHQRGDGRYPRMTYRRNLGVPPACGGVPVALSGGCPGLRGI